MTKEKEQNNHHNQKKRIYLLVFQSQTHNWINNRINKQINKTKTIEIAALTTTTTTIEKDQKTSEKKLIRKMRKGGWGERNKMGVEGGEDRYNAIS